MHWTKHLNIQARINLEFSREPVFDSRHQRRENLFRAFTLNEMEIRFRNGSRRQLTPVYGVGSGHNLAVGSLAKYFSQPDHWNDVAGNQIPENIARADRWQLIGITDQYQSAPRRMGLEE